MGTGFLNISDSKMKVQKASYCQWIGFSGFRKYALDINNVYPISIVILFLKNAEIQAPEIMHQ
jgi:hypothetical protein